MPARKFPREFQPKEIASMIDVRAIAAPKTAHPHHPLAHNYSKKPMLVYWEMTQACALACRHCRAEAISTPHPGELTRTESMKLLNQIAAFDAPLPHLILTGGDPLQRPDLYEVIDEA